MEEIIDEFICRGLPGYPQYGGNTYHFIIKKNFLATGEFTGSYRIEIPRTALNKEQEIATHPEQEKFLFETPLMLLFLVRLKISPNDKDSLFSNSNTTL